MRVPGKESVRKKKEAGSWESERGMEENWDCQSDGDKVSLCLLSKYNFLHPTHPEEKYLSLKFFFFLCRPKTSNLCLFPVSTPHFY